jgi:tripartite-type tricarboxylate transporter receptor subunit TctC
MSVSFRRVTGLTIGLLALLALIDAAGAEDYPARPIAMVVPYAPGGPTDIVSRVVAGRMGTALGKPVVVDNVPGASGVIGVTKAARATPDGYTLSMGNWSTHVLNGAVFSLPFDLQAAFDPVAQIASDPPLIVARKDSPANSLTEFIGWLKANPDKATEGTGGTGTVAHVLGVFFQQRTGTHFQFVPYRGGVGPAMQDLLAGNIDMMFSVAANAVPLIRSGTIKAYAVTAERRLETVPDVPTVDEAGLPSFYAANWHGLWVPKGTPPATISLLNQAVVATLADPDVRAHLADLGQDIAPREQQTPQGLARLQKAEIEKWWPIIKDAGITAQ